VEPVLLSKTLEETTKFNVSQYKKITKLKGDCGELLKKYEDFYPKDELSRHKHDFVLREEEDSVKDYVAEFLLFLEEGTRFLIITGEGGIGKTRLCIELVPPQPI